MVELSKDVFDMFKDMCSERHTILESRINDLREDNKETNEKIETLRTEMNSQFNSFRNDVAKMIAEASQGKVTVTHKMSGKDRVIVYGAFISGGASITVAVIELIGSRTPLLADLLSVIIYLLGVR